MRWYLFLSRVALVGNIFFVIFLIGSFYRVVFSNELSSFITSMWVFSMIANAIVFLAGIGLLIFDRKQLKPVWLITINFIMFAIQVYQISQVRISIL